MCDIIVSRSCIALLLWFVVSTVYFAVSCTLWSNEAEDGGQRERKQEMKQTQPVPISSPPLSVSGGGDGLRFVPSPLTQAPRELGSLIREREGDRGRA